LREETLIINTGNHIDFSDCCAGVLKKKEMILRNFSDSPLEVAFTCDDPQVSFQLCDEYAGDHGKNRRGTPPELERPHPERLQDISTLIIANSHSNSDISARGSVSSRGSSPGTQPDIQIIDDKLEIGYEKQLPLKEEITRIDELLMRPGQERHIEVCYKPLKDQDFRYARLCKRNFRITISYWQPRANHSIEKKNVQCVARICTSFIEVSPALLNFGDTDVGTLKSLPLFIRNCSDLPAKVELQYVSKVLRATGGEIIIPAKQTLETKIDIFPRKVNPDYQKVNIPFY
jgi:hypothetical protein